MSKIVDRTLDFLELFAVHKRPLSLSEIARLLDIPPSSCHDVMQALLKRGYLYEFAARGGCYPTLRLYQTAKIIADHDPLALRADAILKSLRDQIDESILLAKVTGFAATYLLVIEPSHPLRFLATVGENVRSLHATSAGKALLAGLSQQALNEYLRSAKLAPLTSCTITSKSVLRKELAAGNRRGWFANREESLQGVTTVSARFVWISGTYIVTIAGPSSRLETKLNTAADLLMSACNWLEAPPLIL